MGLWGAAMFAATASLLIEFPGAEYLNAFSSMILLYAPVSLLVGWLGSQVTQQVGWTRANWQLWAGAGLVVVVALVGVRQSIALSDPSYELVKAADLEAMNWIREHTPPDARFLVNGFLVFRGTSIVGSDAGWWIPFFTGRSNTMPPQYALYNEEEIEPGYSQRLVALVTDLQNTSLATAEAIELLCGEGITHLYIGQGAGRVGKPPPDPLFTAKEALQAGVFDVLYRAGRVRVLALQETACEP
jgi:hypothetical protein